MPIQVPELIAPVESMPAAASQSSSASSGQLSDDLVNQVVERVMALLLQDLKYERERQRSVGRTTRLKGVR